MSGFVKEAANGLKGAAKEFKNSLPWFFKGMKDDLKEAKDTLPWNKEKDEEKKDG